MDRLNKPVAEKTEEGKTTTVCLAAFAHDAQLSVEAATQLVKMAMDKGVQAHKGKELGTISEDELLSKLD